MKTEGSYLKLFLLPEEMTEIINEDLRSPYLTKVLT